MTNTTFFDFRGNISFVFDISQFLFLQMIRQRCNNDIFFDNQKEP
jgi:hypothetical protein